MGYDGSTQAFERLITRAPRYLQIGALPRPVTVDLPGGQGTGSGTQGVGGSRSATSGTRVLSCR